MVGNLEIKSRPLRLGLLVNPSRVNSVRQAIEVASSLWGGAHFPIIPIFNKRTPKNWEAYSKALSAKKVFEGYVEAFDPDILVQCTKQLPEYTKDCKLKIVKPTDIWKPLVENKERSLNYGVGVFELYEEIFEKHFRYKEKYPIRIILPKIPHQQALFWQSVFGSYPKVISQHLNKSWKNALEIITPKIDKSRFYTMLKGKNFFPRRLTQYELNYFRRSGFHNDFSIFFMDASKTLDIIDYWNLRALGRQVLPVPIQLINESGLKKYVSDFINSSYHPYKHNPQLFNDASFIRSRNTKMEEMQEYAKGLNLKAGTYGKPQYSLQHWYPRIWNDWARDKDGAEADDIYHQEESIDINELNKKVTVQIKPLTPIFMDRLIGHGIPRIANDISFRIYGGTEPFAQVFPKSNGEKLLRAIGDFTSMEGDWRVGRNGLVKLVNDSYTDRWNIPKAEDTFFAWLKDEGWKPELSTPGLLGKQILEQMDGFVRTFANEKLLKLLEYMNGGNEGIPGSTSPNERELSVAEIKSKLKQFSRNKDNSLYEYLLEKNVFRIGLKIKCPNCHRNSWYSLDSIEKSMICPRCLNNFSAIGNVEISNWNYKTTGPFSVPGYADGAICVLLSLEFIEREIHGLKVTPVYSFTAKNSKGKDLEADFASLWQEQSFRNKEEGVLFGECKTFGMFKRVDFKRMKMIANEFPGAILVFSTLKKTLSKNEKKELISITKAGRKLLRSERPINPVLILTGNEILDEFGPPHCWENLPNAKKFEHVYGILEMANATQQIYLDLPPWEEEWYKKIEEKRNKSKAKVIPKIAK